MRLSTPDLVIGLLLTVLGGLALLGRVGLGFMVLLVGVLALIVGILQLLGRVSGSKPVAISLVVVGVLLLVPNFIGDLLGDILETVAAAALLVLGILKLMGRW